MRKYGGSEVWQLQSRNIGAAVLCSRILSAITLHAHYPPVPRIRRFPRKTRHQDQRITIAVENVTTHFFFFPTLLLLIWRFRWSSRIFFPRTDSYLHCRKHDKSLSFSYLLFHKLSIIIKCNDNINFYIVVRNQNLENYTKDDFDFTFVNVILFQTTSEL